MALRCDLTVGNVSLAKALASASWPEVISFLRAQSFAHERGLGLSHYDVSKSRARQQVQLGFGRHLADASRLVGSVIPFAVAMDCNFSLAAE